MWNGNSLKVSGSNGFGFPSGYHNRRRHSLRETTVASCDKQSHHFNKQNDQLSRPSSIKKSNSVCLYDDTDKSSPAMKENFSDSHDNKCGRSLQHQKESISPSPATPNVSVSYAPDDDLNDTFAQFYYHSRHIASPRPSPPASPSHVANGQQPPEVVLEIPSDSDSSRRPSQAPSDYSQFSVSITPSPTPSNQSFSRSRRRASHSGELATEVSLLGVPSSRQRGDSLPGNIDDDQLYTLRNFHLKGSKVINRGDSVKSRSRTSLNSRRSSIEPQSGESSASERFSRRSSVYSSRRSSRRHSFKSSHKSSLKSAEVECNPGQDSEDPEVNIIRVLLLGAGQVGKSSLCAQFMSSDHVNTYLKVEDDVCKEVSVNIDGLETRIVFVDHQHGEISVENQLSTYSPDAFLIVFAVDDHSSLEQAERILVYIRAELETKPCILVANKTDLVRNRVVRTSAGKQVAQRHNIKYIETSPGINHNIDELLVGVVTQLKLRRERQEEKTNKDKFLDFFGKVLSLQVDKSKSCSNLNAI